MNDRDKELINQILNMKTDFSKAILSLDENKLLKLCHEDDYLLSEMNSLEALSEVLQISLQEIEKENIKNYQDLLQFIMKLYTLALIKMNINEDEANEKSAGEA